jgi:hypothetical protein
VGVVAAEWMRNAFLAQAVFVPGILDIYGELLSQSGVCLCKLLPLEGFDPEQPLSFGELLTTLYRRDGLLAVAVQLREGDRQRVVLNPQPRSRDYFFTAGQVVSVFAAGPTTGLARASSCPGCPVGSG